MVSLQHQKEVESLAKVKPKHASFMGSNQPNSYVGNIVERLRDLWRPIATMVDNIIS